MRRCHTPSQSRLRTRLTKSACDALSLDRVLRSIKLLLDGSLPTDVTRRYLELHYARLDGMWDSTRAIDYGFVTTDAAEGESKTRRLFKFQRAFTRFLFDASNKDESGQLGSHLMQVFSMLRSPLALFSPTFLLRAVMVHFTSPHVDELEK